MKLNKNGLSTVKIITVMAITSLWVSIALPALFHFNIESNEAQALNHIQKLTNACEKFKAQNGKYPENLQALSKFIKEGLTSPGYHFQYEFLYEGFILVGLPNNNFSGTSGFYSDSEGTSIVVPDVTKSQGGGGTGAHPFIQDVKAGLKEVIKNKGPTQPTLTVVNIAGQASVLNGQIDTRTAAPQDNTLRGKETTSPVSPKLPKIDHGFAELVGVLESVSSNLDNSAALAKNETKISGPLAAIDKNKDIFQVNYREQFSLAKTREIDTSVSSTSSSTGSSTSTTTTTTTTSSTTSSTSTEDSSGRTRIPQHKK